MNMNNNGYFTPYGFQNGAQVYGQQKTIPMTQPLTPAEIAQLKQKGPAFSLAVDPIEMTASKCTHKENNAFNVSQNADGSLHCNICGANFRADWTQQDVEGAARVMEDILQTIKLQYLTIPEGVATQYFAMIPLLRKAPKLYEIAANEFAKNEQGNPIYDQNSQRGFAMLNMLANPMAMYNPAMMSGMQMPQQQYYDPNVAMYTQQQMQYQPQPMVTGQMPNAVNPFAMNGGMVDPSANHQPAMTAQPTQPQAQSAEGVTNSKVLNV